MSKLPPTPGAKLRTRAVLLCKEPNFWKFLNRGFILDIETEADAVKFIYDYCQIKSRSEMATNHYAQAKFMALDKEYNQWLNPVDVQYADNLSRE